MSVVSGGDGGLESHMEDDLQTPLNELFASPEELIKELCEIQYITTERSASIQWAQRLRFLEVPAADDHSQTWHRSRAKRRKLTKQRTLRLSKPSADRSPETYLAVSYRWLQHDVHSSKEPYLRRRPSHS
ncbi:hypothetical protein M8818_004219 [Zalaria obscura]|uniref:Uncharacterized protein n=1 Tax=Zalaria obscura TaxID=2024903 RepID=A0ACC3SDK3_9PEZI